MLSSPVLQIVLLQAQCIEHMFSKIGFFSVIKKERSNKSQIKTKGPFLHRYWSHSRNQLLNFHCWNNLDCFKGKKKVQSPLSLLLEVYVVTATPHHHCHDIQESSRYDKPFVLKDHLVTSPKYKHSFV